MKKSITVLLILILTALSAISQTSIDTGYTCLPNSQLKAAIILIERGKVQFEELTLLKVKTTLLEQRIAFKDSIISIYEQKDISYNLAIRAYEGSILNLKKIVSNTELQYRTQEKIIRRQKFSKWAALVLGGVAGFVIFK